MIYNQGIFYRLLDKYIENNMDEKEHGFIAGIKWPDNYVIRECPENFWTEIEEIFEIHISVSDKRKVFTVGDMKRLIDSAY